MKTSSSTEYEASVNMRIAESQIQWERYSAMLVVNTIFIGLVGFTYSNDFHIPPIIQFALPPLGIVLCLLWLQMTKRGFMWTKFWTEKARDIEELSSNKQQIQPFVEGKKYKDKNEAMLNTQAAANLIIIMFIFIYSLVFIVNISPNVMPIGNLLSSNTLIVFAICGFIEGILLFRFKAEIFDYNSELGFNTKALSIENGKEEFYLKDKREMHTSAPFAHKVWRFLSIVAGTILGWILLWVLLDQRLKYFSNTDIVWEDIALFLLSYVGISGRLSTVAESVQEWFRR